MKCKAEQIAPNIPAKTVELALRLLVVGCFLGLAGASGSRAADNDLYGCIEIGASGIKAVVVRNHPAASGDEIGTEAVKEYKPQDKNAFKLDATASGRIATAVNQIKGQMENDFNLDKDHLFVVGSSGLREEIQKNLRDTLLQNGLAIDFLTVDQEAKIEFTAVVPRNRIKQAVSIDIGSGNTKGGCWAATEPNSEFITFNVPWGSKTWAEHIDKVRGDTNFLIKADDLHGELLEAVRTQTQLNPGLQNKPRLYLSGGIVWALVTLLKPTDSSILVKLSVADIDTFCQKATDDPMTLLNPDINESSSSSDSDSANTSKAQTEIARVGTVFSENQLMAGAIILKTLRDECYFQRKTAIYFSRNGLYATAIGYVISKLNPPAVSK
ncbi:MAG: hypothetical protein JO308_18645 [Verrucomicrobia bacterium]|nr:hypothetical protein [Verrucomicrobiota bacterium]